ncbi:max-like protein X [Acyrthosiphon pisum]|uniref:BHLH domain-containing protein n=1 Tax=Acyrthosiphon pisum TaxID=7029 RepID=A0A8R1W3H4_ACYPI|nr:max-like protein X [Acyrthosiphon pisum]|eukprot:XP_001951901.2 PREDICTED: max-like protein X [Acyrthosiphon pisum]
MDSIDNMKVVPSSPIQNTNLFSRFSSGSSLHPRHHSSSSSHDDDSEDKGSPNNYTEKRREAHIQSEQKRREAIKQGYNCLYDLVSTYQQTDISGYKLSKATVLQKSIDYIQYSLWQKKTLEKERNALQKEVVALRIMQTNYEQMVNAQQIPMGHVEARISDEEKFQMFQNIIDGLFFTFCNINVNNFTELSACVFSWLEEHCKPQALQNLIETVHEKKPKSHTTTSSDKTSP